MASVAIVGDPLDEIRVDIDPERARSFELTPDEIATAISNANRAGDAGTIKRGQFRFSVRTQSELKDPTELYNIPVGPIARGIKLGDIATITPASGADRVRVCTSTVGAAVGLVVYKDAGFEHRQGHPRTRGTLDALREQFRKSTIKLVAAQAKFVEDALSNLTQNRSVARSSILLILLFLREEDITRHRLIPLSVLIA